MSRHPGVDDYLAAAPPWQAEVMARLRDVIHAAVPDIEETIKRRVQPYFVAHGNVCAFLVTKDHVNLFLYDGAIVPDPEGIITGGHGNSTARMISFYQGDPLPVKALTRMLSTIAGNNRAGGWRAMKAQHAGNGAADGENLHP